MKRSVLAALFAVLLILGGLTIAHAQEQPAPKKDTVNIDTEAKPEFYYAIEDEESSDKKGGSTTTVIIIAAVVIVGGIAVMLLRKKK